MRSETFRFTELYAVALIYHLAIVSALMLGQVWLERRYSAGARDPLRGHTHG